VLEVDEPPLDAPAPNELLEVPEVNPPLPEDDDRPLEEPLVDEPPEVPAPVDPETPEQGATVEDVDEPACEISTPATLQFRGTTWVMSSTKLIIPPDPVEEVLDDELAPAVDPEEVLAGRMSMKTTVPPELLTFINVPVIGKLAEADEPDEPAAALGAALDALADPAAAVEAEPLDEAPAPVRNVPDHWPCVRLCW